MTKMQSEQAFHETISVNSDSPILK